MVIVIWQTSGGNRSRCERIFCFSDERGSDGCGRRDDRSLGLKVKHNLVCMRIYRFGAEICICYRLCRRSTSSVDVVRCTDSCSSKAGGRGYDCGGRICRYKDGLMSDGNNREKPIPGDDVALKF